MKPFSPILRRALFLSLVFLFLVITPAAVFYASGYKLSNLSFVETGGLYISVPISGAVVSINGQDEQVTHLLSRSVYIPDLPPGKYAVDVTAEGYYTWHKNLVVEPKVVTDAGALLIPTDFAAVEILVGIKDSAVASSTRVVSRAEFNTLLDAFKKKPLAVLESEVEKPLEVENGKGLFVENGSVIVRWQKNASSTPSSFCFIPSECAQEIVVKKAGKDKAISAHFFARGVVYATERSGLFFAEIDVRQPQLVVPLYQKRGVDFRIVGGSIIIKEGTRLYTVEGL
ncbi:hypothetical protein EPO56_01765 [Patescibacteria group bacterium]|nr:MAG: hypothetical protein EPO56_01765 [Patescibacteria group bacterium]